MRRRNGGKKAAFFVASTPAATTATVVDAEGREPIAASAPAATLARLVAVLDDTVRPHVGASDAGLRAAVTAYASNDAKSPWRPANEL
mmetsp:Transcript_38506/g.119014  ORF Transcript_38506/g.119014 Transcript_38506/m.119014 type:complete len:88 (+) Transcript_38506:290-553(+)